MVFIGPFGLLIRRRTARNLTREKASGLADCSWQKPQKLPRPGKLSTRASSGAGAATARKLTPAGRNGRVDHSSQGLRDVVLPDDTVLRPSQHHAARRIATPWGAAIFTAASLAHVEPAE